MIQRRLAIIIIITLILLSSPSLISRMPAQPLKEESFRQILEKAENDTQNKNWDDAAAEWEKVNAQNPSDINYCYQLGNAYEQAGNLNRALTVFLNCRSLKAGRSYYDAFNIAKVYAKLGDKPNALKWLKKSFDLGMPERGVFRNQAFGTLKDNAEYQRISATYDVSKLSRNEGWRSDLQFLSDEIRRKAFKVIRDFSPAELDSEVKRIDQLIPKLSDDQIIIEFMKLMTMVGDGQTMLYATRETADLQKNVPVEFYWFKEGLYIIQAEKRYQDLLGARVVSIENKTPEQIYQEMQPILSRDNEQTPKIMSVMRLRQTTLMYAVGLTASPDELKLSLRDLNGEVKNLTLKGDSPIPSRKLWDGLPENWVSLENEIPNKLYYLKNRYQTYWFEYLEKEKTVWFQYNRIQEDRNESWPNFLGRLFDAIEKNPTEKLVIDFRNNNGGNGELAYPLIRALIKCPKINQRGKLFVITGRKTFSAAGITIALLEKHTNAIFAGEPAGTSPSFVGEEFEFELPFSHLTGNVSDREHHYANAVDNRTWIAPLLYVNPGFEDFKNGKDPVWEMILANFPN